jgi:hypothetical protein
LFIRSIILRSFLIAGVLALATQIAYSGLAFIGWHDLAMRLMLPFEYWLTLVFTAKASGLVCSLPGIAILFGL